MSKLARWPRALLVSPDSATHTHVAQVLRGAGFEVECALAAEQGLLQLSGSAPDLLLVELDMEDHDGRWMIRRIRDDYVGKPPRIITLVQPTTVPQKLEGLDTDGILLKPLTEAMLIAAATGVRSTERTLGADVSRELGRLTTLSADVDTGLQDLAKQLARILRVTTCAISAVVGETTRIASSSGDDGIADIESLAALADGVAAPLMCESNALGQQTIVTIPLLTPQGSRLGRIILQDRRLRLLPRQVVTWLRDLGTRLSIELSWRSVHQRIAADRDRLRERAMFDPMLGVLTRTSFEQQLAVDLAALQQRNEPTTLVIFDVRGMREVNDKFGHRAGDRLLKHVASMLTRELRHGDLLARYRGDSFAVALLGTSVESSLAVVTRLKAAVSTPLKHKSHEITPQIYAGISAVLEGTDQAVESLARAAAALRRGKYAGNSVVIADVADVAPPEPEITGLSAGTNLGGMYQVVHEISRGAMGVVYRAEDLGLGRTVALKTLRPDLARDEDLIEMFRREAATLAKLRHDHLVQVYSFDVDQDRLFFVMELVEGQSLEDRVDQVYLEDDYIPVSEIRGFVSQIADALDTMHDSHILHRDVKPANIVQDRRRDRAVLVDFGIASSDEHGSQAGTPGYAAPEIFTGNRQSPATDVYGLAATVYAVLVNDLPFHDDTHAGEILTTLQRQTAGPPEPVTNRRPDIPQAVDEVLARALQPNPHRRYARASEFAAALIAAFEQARAPAPAAGAARGKTTGSARGKTTGSARGTSTTWRSIDGDGRTVEAPEGDTMATAIGPSTRGVLFRAAHQFVMGQSDQGPNRRSATIAGRAATVPGTSWLTQLASRDELLMAPLGPQGAPSGWYPTEAFVHLLTVAAEHVRDPRRFARMLGKNAAASAFTSFYGADPAKTTLVDIVKVADFFWHRFHSWGALETVRGESGIELVITGGPKSELVCSSTMGMLEHIAQASSTGAADISHPSCQSNGAPACRFRLAPRPLASRTQLGR